MNLPAGSIQWPRVRQIGRITRIRTHKKTGETSEEVIHFITSRAESQITPKELLTLMRDHWAIENNLHRTKDVLMNEDRSPVRTKNAPHAMAECRNFVLSLIKKSKKNPKEAIENNQINIKQIIKAVCYGK